MIYYCKDFDEEKCRYKNKALCILYQSLYITGPLRYDSDRVKICGRSVTKLKYVTKFEWLMIKELKEKKQ